MKKSILYIIALVLVFFSSCGENKNALDRKAVVVDIKSLSFNINDTLLFGNEQDIMIQGLPNSVLSIRYVQDSAFWRWTLKEPAYVKFNGTTQNAFDYDSIKAIRINSQNICITKEEIKSVLGDRISEKSNKLIAYFKDGNFRYTRLADILKVKNNQTNPTLDGLKTLVAYNKKGETKLILLDNNIVITKNDNSTRSFDSIGIIPNGTKIEFFRIRYDSFLASNDKQKNDFFHWGDTCFTTSVKPFFTPFGAKEITLTTGKNNTINVSFNKIYRAVIPLQAVDSAYARNEQIPVSLRQMSYANTYSNEVYATNIANPAPHYWEFGTINPSKDYHYEIDDKSPLYKKETISFVLNCGIFWKGLLPLLFVFIIGISVILFGITRYGEITEGGRGDNNRWKWYFFFLYSVLFVLSIGRIFIGYNLSFTQPFAVYAFPTAVIVSPLILLCVLLFWMLFLDFEITEDTKQKRWQRVITYISILSVVLAGICLIVTFFLPDVFKFYRYDINISLFLDKNYVYTTTILGLVVLAFFLPVLCMFGKLKSEKFDKVVNQVNQLMYKIKKQVANLFNLFCKSNQSITQIKTEYNITKIFTIVMLLVVAGVFFIQQSSVSVTLLLFCVLLFWLSSKTKWMEIELMQKILTKRFAKSRSGIFVWILIILGVIAACIALFLHNSGGYIITLLSILVIIPIVIFEAKKIKGKLAVRVRKMRLSKFILLLIPLVFAGGLALFRHDSGYIINLIFFPVFMSVVLFFRYHFYGSKEHEDVGNDKRLKDFFISLSVFFIVFVCSLLFAWLNAKDYDPFSSDRLTERSVAYFDFSTIQDFGYRLSEERAQFFAILTKYSYPSDYDCYEPMHPGISSFTDPVIENDLSVPFGLIYQFGTKWWFLPIASLFFIWGLLCFFVLKMTRPKSVEVNMGEAKKFYFSTYGIIRIFCMSLILGSGLWLIGSYYGVVPFTGRLIYGLGQDSIGEVFDTVFLFAFMGLCGIANDNEFTRAKK